jgi:hypothetical protein
MTEAFESELRTALANGARALPVDGVIARLRTVDYSSRRRQRWILPITAVTGTALAAAALTVVLLSSGSSGPEVLPLTAPPHVQVTAYVGWTAIPAKASAASVTSARASCGRMMYVRITASDVLLDDLRGPFVEIIYNNKSDGRVWSCISKNGHAQLSGTVDTTANPHPDRYEITRPVYGAGIAPINPSTRRGTRPTPKQASERAIQARKMTRDEIPLSPNSLVTTSGVAGRDVTSVVLILKGGERVRATVQHGWYSAWWPGSTEHRVYAIPVAAEVLTTSGTHTMNLRR